MNHIYVIVEVVDQCFGHGDYRPVKMLATQQYGGENHPAFLDEKKAMQYLETLTWKGYRVERIEIQS